MKKCLIILLCLIAVNIPAKVVIGDKKPLKVNIDTRLFSSTSAKLNKQIYDITKDVVNKEHLELCYGNVTTPLYESYVEHLNPLIPIALTLCESGTWADTRYTWSSAIYSKPLAEAGVDLSSLDISTVDVNTYLANGIVRELGCGSNCTARSSIGDKHYHITDGLNDNDSLGPLQILRRYVESTGGIVYPCGNMTYDLMNWSDNVNYIFHKQSEVFSNSRHWNSSHKINSVYELIALMAVMHNTGGAFQVAKSGNGYAGSKWLNAKAVYNYCEILGDVKSVEILSSYVEQQYEEIEKQVKENKEFRMAGQIRWDSVQISKLLADIGIVKSKYTNGGFSHKQIYPLRAILNYMTLEKLYTSGGASNNR